MIRIQLPQAAVKCLEQTFAWRTNACSATAFRSSYWSIAAANNSTTPLMYASTVAACNRGSSRTSSEDSTGCGRARPSATLATSGWTGRHAQQLGHPRSSEAGVGAGLLDSRRVGRAPVQASWRLHLLVDHAPLLFPDRHQV